MPGDAGTVLAVDDALYGRLQHLLEQAHGAELAVRRDLEELLAQPSLFDDPERLQTAARLLDGAARLGRALAYVGRPTERAGQVTAPKAAGHRRPAGRLRQVHVVVAGSAGAGVEQVAQAL
jgi:hypothetical protein